KEEERQRRVPVRRGKAASLRASAAEIPVLHRPDVKFPTEVLSVSQSIAVVILCLAAASGMLLLLRRLWPSANRRQHNDIVGWQVSILGTMYAVIIAFMLWNVWSNFQDAELNTEIEANSLVSLYRFSARLSPVEAKQIQSSVCKYAEVMLKYEWPAMARE